MDSLQAALVQVREIEAAVAAGDLDLANAAAQNLKPLLVTRCIDDALALREKIEDLTIGVKVLRAQGAADLIKLRQQRGGAALYQQMQRRA